MRISGDITKYCYLIELTKNQSFEIISPNTCKVLEENFLLSEFKINGNTIRGWYRSNTRNLISKHAKSLTILAENNLEPWEEELIEKGKKAALANVSCTDCLPFGHREKQLFLSGYQFVINARTTFEKLLSESGKLSVDIN